MRAATTCLAGLALLIAFFELPAASAHYLRHEPRDLHSTVLTAKHTGRRLDTDVEASDTTPELKSAVIHTLPTTSTAARSPFLRDEPDTLSQREHKGQATHFDEPNIPTPAVAEIIQAKQLTASAKRSGTCIGPVCGLNLFFALISLTFAVCAIVVYIVDRRFNNPWDDAKSTSEQDKNNKRRASGGVDVVRQATAYYQSAAAAMNSKLLRRRPLS